MAQLREETTLLTDRQREAVDELTPSRGQLPLRRREVLGQILKPPHPVASISYAAAALINPNNHALDAGPATSAMEKEVVEDLAEMFGMPQHLGHLTSSGTIANLEALYVARELAPDTVVVSSQAAHYTHGRMSHLLGMTHETIPQDRLGKMDLHALEARLEGGGVGTIVATLGTTSLGALDPVDEIVPMARRYEARVQWTRRTAGSTRFSRPQIRPSTRGRFMRYLTWTRSWSTHTSTDSNHMGVARSSTRTPQWAAFSPTTPRTPISPRVSCTWARSASSAHARRSRCGLVGNLARSRP